MTSTAKPGSRRVRSAPMSLMLAAGRPALSAYSYRHSPRTWRSSFADRGLPGVTTGADDGFALGPALILDGDELVAGRWHPLMPTITIAVAIASRWWIMSKSPAKQLPALTQPGSPYVNDAPQRAEAPSPSSPL